MGVLKSSNSSTIANDDDPLVIVFVFPRDVVYTTPFGTGRLGIYTPNNHPFIKGGGNQPPFPLNIECRKSISNQVYNLMVSLVDDVYRMGIKDDAVAIIDFLQRAEAFERVCRLMDPESPYFWAIILGKRVGIFCNDSFAGAMFAMLTHGRNPRHDWVSSEFTPVPRLPARSSSQVPQTPKHGKAARSPSPNEYDKFLESANNLSPSLRTTSVQAPTTPSTLSRSFSSKDLNPHTPASPSRPSASSNRTLPSPHPMSTSVQHPSAGTAAMAELSAEAVHPRDVLANLGRTGWAFFNSFGFMRLVVEQIGMVFLVEFRERMQELFPEIPEGPIDFIYYLFEHQP
ncbi:hypothetical protein MPER_11941 [Moniliophthora perniciosa FA553]|nr:hypothetical protein MPER_11941 [Moniliophthora perniciosa FA553]